MHIRENWLLPRGGHEPDKKMFCHAQVLASPSPKLAQNAQRVCAKCPNRCQTPCIPNHPPPAKRKGGAGAQEGRNLGPFWLLCSQLLPQHDVRTLEKPLETLVANLAGHGFMMCLAQERRRAWREASEVRTHISGKTKDVQNKGWLGLTM